MFSTIGVLLRIVYYYKPTQECHDIKLNTQRRVSKVRETICFQQGIMFSKGVSAD